MPSPALPTTIIPAVVSSARVSLTANEALNNSSATVIPWDQADWDGQSYWSAGSPTLLTIPATGKYRVTFAYFLSANATTPNIQLQRDAGGGFSTIAWAPLLESEEMRAGTVTAVISATTGDTIRAIITVFAAGLTLNTGDSTWLAIERIMDGGTTGHADDHEAFHPILNAFDDTDIPSTKGDLLVVSGGTVKRLPVGTDGQALLADSAQTAGVKWGAVAGGGMVLIEEVTISSPVASVDLSSIPQTYKDLILELDLVTADAADQDRPDIQFGNGTIDTGSNYSHYGSYTGTSTSFVSSDTATKIQGAVTLAGAGEASPSGALSRLIIFDYASSRWKAVQTFGYKSGDSYYYQHGGGIWRSTSAIDIIRVAAEGGNLTGGTIRLYGVVVQ